MKRIVILGAGTAGTIMANRLRKLYDSHADRHDYTITIVDPEETHVYQPGLLFVPFGIYKPDEIVKQSRPLVAEGVNYEQAGVERVDNTANEVLLTNGATLAYDVLIIATGSRIVPEETEGMTGDGWHRNIFDFYTLEGATRLAHALENFQGGRLVLNVVEMPIKCPVAPLEFAFLADWYFTERGIRDKVKLTYATPLDGAFTKPLASQQFGHLLREKGVELETEFNCGEVDGTAGKLKSWDEREIDFDLLVTIPLHMGAEFVSRTEGLGDEMNWVKTDHNTLQSKLAPNIFAIGDATDVPASKAGSVAHFQAEVLEENIRRYLSGEPLEKGFDGHANCFIETGFKKAALIDFNYDVEPLPGKFPIAGVGPMSLLRESRLNHAGKMAFKWIYWHMLLPGRDLPFVTTRLSLGGKDKSVLEQSAA